MSMSGRRRHLCDSKQSLWSCHKLPVLMSHVNDVKELLMSQVTDVTIENMSKSY